MTGAVFQREVSGHSLAERVRRAAAARGTTVTELLRPIGYNPARLKEWESAAWPRANTVRRVLALIDGAEVPAKQTYLRQPAVDSREAAPALADLPRVDRDPCFYCGVRGDIGCGCGGRR